MIRPSLTDAALAAVGHGWPIFPLLPGTKRPRPQLTAWEAKATLDPQQIARWWTGHPHDNIAIATGPARLVVIDLDHTRPHEQPPPDWPHATGGADVLAELAARHGHTIPPTRTVATPSGGRHLYYWAPAGPALRNTAGRAGWKIDTRAHGGYVVAAGSVVDGRRYDVVDDRPPVDLPAWLADLLRPPAPPCPQRAEPCARRDAGYAAAALEREVNRVLTAPPGTRNTALNLAAWNLARLIRAGLLDRARVEDALCQAGRTAGGQTPTGVAATVRSAINARLRQHTSTTTPAPPRRGAAL
ncbi:MAG TPA: bifunctional DNA primase/polymerase [Acidimicrobiales bacterium]